MSADRQDPEPTYADRTDSIDTKVEILQRAVREGNYELALGVADSIKGTITTERMLHAEAGPVDLAASDWRPTGELPEPGPRWADGWDLCQVLRLSEPIGQARQAEPVDLLVEMPAERVWDPRRDLRVARVDGTATREVRSQVYGEVRRGPRWLAHLVIEADVPADGEAAFLVFCGNPAAELPNYASPLQVRGQGVGLEIETSQYVATLSSQMGQLQKLVPKWHGGGLQLASYNSGHGEPPNVDWAHDYLTPGPFQKMRVTNWSSCPNVEIVRGPLCVIVRRYGFPHSPIHPLFTPSRFFMDLSYTFYASAPYFMKDGHMEAARDFETAVVRDDEWYFPGRAFDAALWMDEAGRVHEGAIPPEHKDRVWGIGFFHRHSRDSMFAIYLDHRLDPPPGCGPEATAGVAFSHNAHATVAHHQPGKPPHAAVWCRPPLGRSQLQTGTALIQRNAYLLARYPEEGGAAGLEALRERLLQPLVRSVSPPSDLGSEAAPPAEAQPLARLGERAADWPRKQAIWEAMREVRDDQLHPPEANVVDLGYIYDVRTRGNDVHVLMTMPHKGRPKYDFIARPLRTRLGQVPGIESVVVDLTWEPGWNPNRLTDAGRRVMGLDLE